MKEFSALLPMVLIAAGEKGRQWQFYWEKRDILQVAEREPDLLEEEGWLLNR